MQWLIMGKYVLLATHDEYMRMSFLMLDMCDAIYMMDGWRESAGACMEYGYALAKDKIILKGGAE